MTCRISQELSHQPQSLHISRCLRTLGPDQLVVDAGVEGILLHSYEMTKNIMNMIELYHCKRVG